MNKGQPKVSWPIEANTYYTFVMVDATPNLLHWLTVNIAGNDLSKGELRA